MRSRKLITTTNSKELLRLETFSDGVFAIAITLLILELVQILHYDKKVTMWDLLVSNWKSFVVFLIGFLTILVCWINHHVVVSYIEKTDSKLFWVNGFVLLVVTFTPFPTAVLAEYLDEESRYALAFFGFNYIMMSIAAYVLSAYILKRLVKAADRELLRYHTLLYKYSIVYTLLAFLTCFVSVIAASLLYLILFIVFAFPKEFSTRLRNWKKRGRSRI